jgi:hypothetical protein
MTTMAALAFYFLLLISEASIAAAQILENTIEVRRKPESRRRGHMVMHRRAPLNWHRVLSHVYRRLVRLVARQFKA